ncbi:spaetzle-processing enzyme isoform X1 [Drosophila mauritiana]|uniref:Spaetzle-processing enzyme isoform X1 n=2 Tax=Drosophila mauritiana TaxID=7226 RepID=A0A6P8K4Y3_DROMA|nr:spaetzle-processing enzyme isoform X1 [Drosophila mauritiana]
MFTCIPFALVVLFIQFSYSTKFDCYPDEKYVYLFECPHVYNSGMSRTLMREYDMDTWLPFQRICCPPPGNRLPSPEICVRRSRTYRIVGGLDAKPNEYPWLAMLLYLNKLTLEITPSCTGSLINNRYVLTSAHCVDGFLSHLSLKRVRLGEHNITSDPGYNRVCRDQNNHCALPNLEIGFERIIVHGEYKGISEWKTEYDIALVRLKMPVRYRTGILPICIPKHGLFAESQFEIAGWGKTNEFSQFSKVLKHGLIRKRKIGRCASRFPHLRLSNSLQICAGGDSAVDTCDGDSGSPLMVTMPNGSVYLAGITSFGGENCGQIGSPAVYTRTSAFLPWINEALNI